ncbi:hypothetical protein niasHT_000404 [Heterodera trifolii]|uniref:Uncharacterized protein n=1 Tax=Heterodera trifolii TaxID=157864 RepID=A0ABD2M1A2_9BILA
MLVEFWEPETPVAFISPLVLVVVLHSSASCCGVFPLSYFVANEMVAQNARSSVQGLRTVFCAAIGGNWNLFVRPLLETKNRTMAEIENKIAEMMAQKSKHREEKRDRKTNFVLAMPLNCREEHDDDGNHCENGHRSETETARVGRKKAGQRAPMEIGGGRGGGDVIKHRL